MRDRCRVSPPPQAWRGCVPTMQGRAHQGATRMERTAQVESRGREVIEPKNPGRGTSTSHANRIPLPVGGYAWRKDEPDAQPTPREDKYRPPKQERRYLEPPTLRETCGKLGGPNAHARAGESSC